MRTKTSVNHIIAVGLLVMLTGCTPAPEALTLMRGDVVLAFGDSLTFGTGATVQESYPAVLAELIGREVVRSGVPGEVSAKGLARLPGELERVKPALVILCHGGNDILRNLPARETRENLDAMVKLAHAAGARVMLLAVPGRSLTLRPPAYYRDVAADNGATLVEAIIPEILGNPRLKSDRVHPNSAGYRMIAQAVAQRLAAS